jgi:aminopeptidase N
METPMLKKKIKFILTALILAVITVAGCKEAPEKGVTLKMASERKMLTGNVEYTLHFSIPSAKSELIMGKNEISFSSVESEDVVIDFREDEKKLLKVSVDNKPVDFRFENGHITVPGKHIKAGKNIISIEFIAGDGSLNRKDDFLYTLFVPDRASTAFPCFDQPDMKALYSLVLDIPSTWQAVSNGSLVKTTARDSVKTLSFRQTKPISTYLFAFAAGRFDTLSRGEKGRRMTIFHRENDSLSVARNIDAIFAAHFSSLEWLKDYTGINYPFGKLDVVLIPDFQYSGMEHPGAIFYRDSPMFLNENPGINQKLTRSNLIAHEVSHQWFGDLVTMRWFNDVWMKEVFAGFMADKIVNPQYPEIDHSLSFLLSHYPRAYSTDRTAGANPIRQNLDNLLFAGTLYGDIIYHKAPVMMMQLELLMGADEFKKGIRKYLEKYSYKNAEWNDLISILDQLTPYDLEQWSKSWVENAGMPVLKSVISFADDGKIKDYCILQSGKDQHSPVVAMQFRLAGVGFENKSGYNAEMTTNTLTIDQLHGKLLKNWILPNSDGKGYGTFYPDSLSLQLLFNDTTLIENNLERASWFVMLNEIFLNGKVQTEKYFLYLLSKISIEKEPQVRLYLLNNIELVWWRFLSENQRMKYGRQLENGMLQLIASHDIKDEEKKPIFWTFARTANTKEALKYVFDVWKNKTVISGIKFDEPDYMTLAFELALRGGNNSDSIIAAQEIRIKNRDRLAKFRFMKRAVSPDISVRDSFFMSLSDPANRRPEPWVTEALQYFHHPLRSAWSVKYLKPSLDLLPEIQRTGDIFFPKSWLDATLRGYNNQEAYLIIEKWLKENPGLTENLRNKVIQSADILKRASESNR